VELLTKKGLKSNARNLDFFDAVFFMTTGELPLDESQKADLLSFVKDDGKGFLGAHNATDTFYKWPAFGEMIGGYFDGHPWNQEVTIKVEDPTHPATKLLGPSFKFREEALPVQEFLARQRPCPVQPGQRLRGCE
jgi:type 1 glutamine amidotransferase